LLDLDLEDIKKCMSINVTSHFQLLKHFLPDLIKTHGHVLATGSIMGLTSASSAVDYCCSKYAVTGMMEALRQEVGNQVYVSVIFPGLVSSGMFDGLGLGLTLVLNILLNT
jgi:short-subunit dehydrogenase